jgi:hypothetical protein
MLPRFQQNSSAQERWGLELCKPVSPRTLPEPFILSVGPARKPGMEDEELQYRSEDSLGKKSWALANQD